MSKFDGKVIVITGAAGGIGTAAAKSWRNRVLILPWSI